MTTTQTSYPYYAIVTFGSAAYGGTRSYYRALESAKRDARELGGGSLSTVRVVGCQSVREAREADIAGPAPVVWTR